MTSALDTDPVECVKRAETRVAVARSISASLLGATYSPYATEDRVPALDPSSSAFLQQADRLLEVLQVLGYEIVRKRPSAIVVALEQAPPVSVQLSEPERYYLDAIVDSGLNGANRSEVIRDAVRMLIQSKVSEELLDLKSFSSRERNDKKKK